MAEEAAHESPQSGSSIPLETLLGSFRGPVPWQRASFFYTIGLLLVTLAIVVLPFLYLVLLGFAGYLVFWWATRFAFLLSGPGYGLYFLIIKFLIYFTPLFTGGIVLFFMVKPLLARRPSYAQPLALNPGSEPLLFAFITRICKTIGAPFPSRIDVDCNLNASASFRRGFKSILGNDLVLTLGLPLVAGMTVTQLAGVIAHEFGHFTQGFAMRLNYIIRRVISWFARVIYHRDQWDYMIEEWAMEAQDWRAQLLIATARLGVWFSRLILKALMWIGLSISSFISRQMEFNADLYNIDLVGSSVFEESTVRLEILSAGMKSAYQHIQQAWISNKVLPDNFPAFLLLHEARIPEGTRVAIADRIGLQHSGIFSTHPSDGDRIRCARLANKAGVFSLDAPASNLFENFEVLARQVSMLHYTEDHQIPLPLIQFRSPQSFFEMASPAVETSAVNDTARAELEKTLGPSKLKLQRPG